MKFTSTPPCVLGNNIFIIITTCRHKVFPSNLLNFEKSTLEKNNLDYM
jgi:hypothetical protein